MTRTIPPNRRAAVAAIRTAGIDAVFWLALVAATLAVAGSAHGQDNPPAPPGTIAPPGSQAANPKNPGAATPDSPGTGLRNGSGEIRPPVDVDPGIAAPAPVPPPATSGTVIAPPGSPGGDPTVQPK